MKNSKYVQLDTKVLMEYIYDDSNLNAENYIITYDKNENVRSYSANNTEGVTNKLDNQYVIIDPISNKAGIRNENNYNFIENKEYSQTLPIRYDKIRLHFPSNYNFEDSGGCYVRIYVMDSTNTNSFNLVQYYFDKQDQFRFSRELNLSPNGNKLNGQIWGKFIEIAYPSPYTLSLQKTNNLVTPNSINYNLSDGIGISQTSPIMIEFGFIEKKDKINDIITYIFSSPYQTSVPLTPDFENLGLKISPAEDGDWFEIYGTFNGEISQFNEFITSARNIGKRYYVEYIITQFEENIKGKSLNITIEQDFNEVVDYRPIIKYSTTTATIDVSMRIIDKNDGSIITRRASYGMLSDELSKYSRSLVKINVSGQITPKIYNIRNGGSIFDAFDGLNKRNMSDPFNTESDGIEIIRVPYPALVSINNIVAKTDSALVNGKEWKGFGKLKLVIDPFDNLIKFILAKQIEDKVEYFNLLEMGEINLFFKNFESELKTNLYRQSDENDLERGTVIFKLKKDDVSKVRRIYQSGINMFYITSTNIESNETNVIYEGTFIMSDSIEYTRDLAQDYQNENDGVEIRRDNEQEYAIVTRKRVQNSVSSNRVTDSINVGKVDTNITVSNNLGPISGGLTFNE